MQCANQQALCGERNFCLCMSKTKSSTMGGRVGRGRWCFPRALPFLAFAFYGVLRVLLRMNHHGASSSSSSSSSSLHEQVQGVKKTATTTAAAGSNQMGHYTEGTYDMVVLVTVWKRATLREYLEMLSEQNILWKRPEFALNVIIFQNGHHMDVDPIVQEWNTSTRWGGANVKLDFIQSPIPTGYFGRFLVPLLSNVRPDTYFLICDDDVFFGSRYLENMIRVIDGGSLAGRIGRMVGLGEEGFYESGGASGPGWREGVQVTYDTDVEYDFAGHLWGGRIDWLRKAWMHPPPLLVTCEDFWISSVLRTYYGIGTKRPRCPASDVEQCACSMQVANDHQTSELGSKTGGELDRHGAIRAIASHVGYRRINESMWEAEAAAYTFHEPGAGPFNLQGTRFEKCWYWI